MAADPDEKAPDLGEPELLELEAQIAGARERVALSANALQRQLTEVTDWREWVRRKPVLTLGLAFGLGVTLGRGRR
jgi:hypothetical protein